MTMSKIIDAELVRHIGKLSRISLSDAEVAALGEQIGAMVEYFDKLQQLDTNAVEPMAHAVELTNVLAPDEPGQSLSPAEALANSPQHDENFFKVPKVLGADS
ncbi:MAG: Asp-tRNA(Asn)/Glu-tRNA(Gln) amidotransferase GatCAB subunit C [Planctomycetota bacterium]|nr:MAG: Asp-tRNA(Asn)/Glu-tRNA(Gln) amidotransferase GatCAB subunit C [Planctomycetota bacterium]